MLPSTIITLVWKGPRHNFVDPHGKLLETNNFQIRSIFASSNFHTHLNILVSANFNFQKYSPSYIYSQRCMHVCMVHMCIAVCMWKRDARTERASVVPLGTVRVSSLTSPSLQWAFTGSWENVEHSDELMDNVRGCYPGWSLAPLCPVLQQPPVAPMCAASPSALQTGTRLLHLPGKHTCFFTCFLSSKAQLYAKLSQVQRGS